MEDAQDDSYPEDILLSLTGVRVTDSLDHSRRVEEKIRHALGLAAEQISVVDTEEQEGDCSCHGELESNIQCCKVMFVVYPPADGERITGEQLAQKMNDFIHKSATPSAVKEWLYVAPESKTDGGHTPCTYCTSATARCTVVAMEEDVEILEEEAFALWRDLPDDQRTSHLALVPSPDGAMIQPTHGHTTVYNTNTSTVVVLLCGLPGSGKSTLSRQLVSACQKNSNGNIVNVTSIEYDGVEADLLQQQAANDKIGPSSVAENEAASFTREIWKKSRLKSMDMLRESLSTQQQEKTLVISEETSQSTTNIIIMDDNFHLRSMRRDVYRICQEVVVSSHGQQKIHFVTLWLDVPKEICLERNQQRDRIVPDEVVLKMSETLEPPGKESFERCYKRISDHPSTFEEDNNIIMSSDIASIYDFVTRECLEQYEPVPLPPPPIDLEQLEEERRKTRESWLHTWDQQLRSWVGIVAQISRKDTGNANKARKELLQILRQQVQQKNGGDGCEDTALPGTLEIADQFLILMGTQKLWTEEQETQFHTAVSENENAIISESQIASNETSNSKIRRSSIIEAQLRRDPSLLELDNVRRVDISQLNAMTAEGDESIAWTEPVIITGCVSPTPKPNGCSKNRNTCTPLLLSRVDLTAKHGDTQVRTGNRNTLIENGFDNSIPMSLGQAMQTNTGDLSVSGGSEYQIQQEYSRIVFSPVKELPDLFKQDLESLLDNFPPFPLVKGAVGGDRKSQKQKYTLCIAGKEGFGIGFHKHNAAFFMLLEGRKKWYMGDSSSPSLDPTKTREPTHPGFYTSKSSHKCIQNPGEVLYVPDQWYHEIFNLEYTVGIQALPA